MLVIEKGKIVKSVGIELPDGKVIKSLQQGEIYKDLGILEADRFLGEEMKLKVFKYFRNLRKVFEVKVDSLEFSSRKNFKQIRHIMYDCQVHLDFSSRSQYIFLLEFTP